MIEVINSFSRVSIQNNASIVFEGLTISERMKAAYQLAKALKALHDQDIVHRDISWLHIIKTAAGDLELPVSEDQASDSTVCSYASILGHPETMAPERFEAHYVGSWKPDDIYQLACVFSKITNPNLSLLCEGMESIEDNRKLKMGLESSSKRALELLSYPQLPETTLTFLSQAMMHPDPKQRPTIDAVCKKLEGLFSLDLPLLSSVACHKEKVAKIDFTFSKLDSLVNAVLEMLRFDNRTPYQYATRKESGTAYKILASTGKDLLILLPKKKLDKSERDAGTFKEGRKGVALLVKDKNDIWRAIDSYALSSRKDREAAHFKASYAKEQWLNDQRIGDIFPKHLYSFAFSDKPHKRLSLYESGGCSLWDWCKDHGQIGIVEALSLATLVCKLHDKGFAHRDLKAENILTADGKTFKLCDVDSVVLDTDWMHVCDTAGTYDYMPPERFFSKEKLSWFPDDIYALGCFFYMQIEEDGLPWNELELDEMYEEKLAFKEEANFSKEQLEEVLDGGITDPDHAFELLTCWMIHPERALRPSSMKRVCEILQAIVAAT